VSTKYRCHGFCHLDLPFRNVTPRWLGRAAGGRGAQRSAAPDRRPIYWSSQPHPFLPSERPLARLVDQFSRS
jgi:hypothetical protein